MITEWDIYWLTRMDQIVLVLKAVAIFSGVVGVISFCIAHVNAADKLDYTEESRYYHQAEKWEKTARTVAWVFLPLFIITLTGWVFTPTTRELAAIKIIPKIANNEALKGLGSDIVELAKEWIKELKPKPETDLKKVGPPKLVPE